MQRRIILALCGAWCAIAAAPAPAQRDHAIPWYTIDGGGGMSAGGTYELSGTIGQPDAGSMTGGTYELAGGFWAGGPVLDTCSADINGDNVVDVADLLNLLSDWGPCAAACPTDMNGDDVVDVSDLLILFSAWGPCP